METPKSFESQEEFVFYSALFVDDLNQLKEKYPPVHPNEYYHHSTIAFEPEDGKTSLNVGEKYNMAIIGRVTSDKVDVLLVQNEKSKNEYPYITLSTVAGVEPFVSNEEIKKAVKEGRVIPVGDSLSVTEGYSDGGTDIIN
ncbi:MAG: hypothetical protein AAFQ87_02635 [Bacteroidota bacterium]